MKEVFSALWGKIEQVNKGKSTIYSLLFVTTVTRWISDCMSLGVHAPAKDFGVVIVRQALASSVVDLERIG